MKWVLRYKIAGNSFKFVWISAKLECKIWWQIFWAAGEKFTIRKLVAADRLVVCLLSNQKSTMVLYKSAMNQSAPATTASFRRWNCQFYFFRKTERQTIIDVGTLRDIMRTPVCSAVFKNMLSKRYCKKTFRSRAHFAPFSLLGVYIFLSTWALAST